MAWRARGGGWSTLSSSSPSYGPAPGAPSGVGLGVQEVTVVTPTMIAVEVLDQPANPNIAGDVATQFVNTALTDVASNWSMGGNTVTAVYRKSLPWRQEGVPISGGTNNRAILRHYIYLELLAPITSGTSYTINFPAGSNIVPQYLFHFDDTKTVMHSLHAKQSGFRPTDDCKIAYIKSWVPYFGTTDYIGGPLALTQFQVIDSTGAVVFTGNTTTAGVVQNFQMMTRTTPTTNTGPQYVGANTSFAGNLTFGTKPVTAVSYPTSGPQAGLVVLTCPAHGFTTGQIFYCDGMCSDFNANPSNPIYNPQQLNEFVIPNTGDFGCIVGTVVDANNFTVNDITNTPMSSTTPNGNTNPGGPWTDFFPGTMQPGFDSLLYTAEDLTQSQCYVVGLDFSAWTGGNGVYRLRIPGIGVSYPFNVNSAAYLADAMASSQGFNNQCSGMALTGWSGWTHPAAFVDGVSPNGPSGSTAIYWSNLPGMFTNECQYGGSTNSLAGFGATSAWLTANRATGIYGGYRDAGDWATICWSHALATYSLLAIDEAMQAWGAPNTDFGFPRMSQVLDPVLYAGTDGLSDSIHQAMWEIDFYRRTQITTGPQAGAVAGGILFGEGGSGDGGNCSTPSWENPLGIQVFLAAPDHAATFAAALLFAKASERFAAHGFSTLASTYLTAAENAFAWANNLYGDLANESAYYNGVLNLSTYITTTGNQAYSVTTTNGNATIQYTSVGGSPALTNGAVISVSASAGNAGTPAGTFTVTGVVDSSHVTVTPTPGLSVTSAVGYICGWTTTQFDNAMAAADASPNGDATSSRYAAAGALYRLTGNDALYGSIVEADAFPPGTSFWLMVGLWEYVNASSPASPNPLAGFNQNIGFSNQVTQAFNQTNDPFTAAYATGADGNIMYGKNLAIAPFANGIWAHINYPGSTVYSNTAFKKQLRQMWQACQAHTRGANQYRTCFTGGLGTRQILWGTVGRDREAQGIPQPPGYTNYVFGGGFIFLNLAFGGSPSSFTNTIPAAEANGSFPGEFNLQKSLWPNRYATPVYEWIIENSYMIGMMEYTTEESIIPQQTVDLFLSGWDGN